MAEDSRALRSDTAVSTDCEDASAHALSCQVLHGPAADAGNPILDAATGNLGRGSGSPGLLGLDPQVLESGLWKFGGQEKKRRTRSRRRRKRSFGFPPTLPTRRGWLA